LLPRSYCAPEELLLPRSYLGLVNAPRSYPGVNVTHGANELFGGPHVKASRNTVTEHITQRAKAIIQGLLKKKHTQTEAITAAN
jgi:hypothetical protein